MVCGAAAFFVFIHGVARCGRVGCRQSCAHCIIIIYLIFIEMKWFFKFKYDDRFRSTNSRQSTPTTQWRRCIMTALVACRDTPNRYAANAHAMHSIITSEAGIESGNKAFREQQKIITIKVMPTNWIMPLRAVYLEYNAHAFFIWRCEWLNKLKHTYTRTRARVEPNSVEL